jgi:hypothetical protein
MLDESHGLCISMQTTLMENGSDPGSNPGGGVNAIEIQ